MVIMAKKEPRTVGTTVTLQQLETEPGRVAAAARRAGGVDVVDANGRLQFKLSMPVDRLPALRG